MLDQIEQWYLEAAALYGDDWRRIERHVAQKMAAIGPAEQMRLSKAFEALFPGESGLPN